ncbi:hypothetical protein [Clostridium sp.]|uniref:hypothetical protein n=1 Tax=Clostridium sp. TaxID=1506 RepID=UPI002FC84F93
MGAMIIVMPQMFFSGTIIPIAHSTGIIEILAKLMTLTYLDDLAWGVFYTGHSVYELFVLHHPIFNITVITAFFLVFSIMGTIMFTKSEQNR